MAVVDTALLLLCRSHQAHSVDNQMLASLQLCLSSMFSWYRKAQLDSYPCVAFGTHAEEQPLHLNCSYLQQKKESFDEIISVPKETIFFFFMYFKDLHQSIQDYCYLLKVATTMSSINKCTPAPRVLLWKSCGGITVSPVEHSDLFSAKSNKTVGEIIILVSRTSSILFLWPVLPPFVLLPAVLRFTAKAHPGISLCL